MKANWKTTLAGVLTIVAAVAGAGAQYLQGDSVDWQAVITIVTAALAGLGLIAAQDSRPNPPRPETPDEVKAAWARVLKPDK